MSEAANQRILLIVEDSLTDREMYCRYLMKDSQYNYQIIGVETGEEALERFDEIKPDLILVDFLLPDMDGLELIELIRIKTCLHIPVIMLTGQGNIQVAVQAMKKGFQDYLVKGNITSESLLKTIDSVFDRVELLKQIERNQQQRRIVSTIALRIRQSLNLEEILETSVNEVRSFLNCDRVVVYQFQPGYDGEVIAESVKEGWLKTIKISSQDMCCQPVKNRINAWESYHANNNIYNAGYSDCHVQMLEHFQIKANLIFPIFVLRNGDGVLKKELMKSSQIWGLLIAHQCDDFREWKTTEIELLEELSVQIAIGIQQAQLYEDLKQLNYQLEEKVRERTAKLKESEQKFRAIFNNTFQLTGLLTINGLVVELNQTALTWENLSRKEVINRPFWEISICQRASSQTQDKIRESISQATQGEFIRDELETFDIQGNAVTLDFSLRPLRDETGKVLFLILEARDITERKISEKILKETNTKLEQSTRLKDEFLANMSHELRTPLNAILGFSEALEGGFFGELNPKQYNSILTIIKSGKHLLELINDILDISKIESGKLVLNLEQVNLQVLCHSSLDFVRPQAVSKKIQLNDEITNKITTIEADERHLRQMLVNLLGNAVKFTPEKGLVTLIVEENFTDSTISFKVIDTGIGIAPEHHDQLFQPFVQIDSGLSKNYPGTGLGLALVKRITEMHKGQVGVQSKLGEGSQFTVKLPLINFEKNNNENQAISAQHFEDQNIVLESKEFNKNSLNSSTEKQPELTSPLILIADDNEANVDTILDYFELKGYQLIVAKNGLETIQLAKEQQPQLILMDIQMPKIDGLEAIRTIRADPEIAKIKILALTAFARAEDREKCLEAGANDYLAKPFGLKNLSDKIEQLLLLD